MTEKDKLKQRITELEEMQTILLENMEALYDEVVNIGEYLARNNTEE